MAVVTAFLGEQFNCTLESTVVVLHAQLKRFRAGIEAGISYLKRCFGLGRCRWRGLARFQAYVQGAVVAHNLVRLARLGPAPG